MITFIIGALLAAIIGIVMWELCVEHPDMTKRMAIVPLRPWKWTKERRVLAHGDSKQLKTIYECSYQDWEFSYYTKVQYIGFDAALRGVPELVRHDLWDYPYVDSPEARKRADELIEELMEGKKED